MPHPLETATDLTETPWARAACRRFEHPAMATMFELYVFGPNARQADHAAVAAFELIDHLEEELSYFVRSSDVARINRLGAGQSLRVGLATMDCLELARRVYDWTAGAFDPTVGALLSGRHHWNQGPPHAPDNELDNADHPVHVGMDLIEISRERMAVGVLTDHVSIDLGGIGKGYALDQAAALLRDWGVKSAMLSAGRSTMLPIGLPPGGAAWRMRVIDPRDERTELAVFDVTNQAVSVSAASAGEPHILDPATGDAALSRLGAWALAPGAALADALSTACMVMPAEQVACAALAANASAMLLTLNPAGALELEVAGRWNRLCCEPIR